MNKRAYMAGYMRKRAGDWGSSLEGVQGLYGMGGRALAAPFGQKAQNVGEIAGKIGGTGIGLGAYFVPGLGAGMSTWDTAASFKNMLGKDKTGLQRAGHGLATVGNAGLAGIGWAGSSFLPGASLIAGAGKAIGKGLTAGTKAILGAKAGGKVTGAVSKVNPRVPAITSSVAGNTMVAKGTPGYE